jgi:UDP-N-acetylglucosamine--dolichyl-phosphate N-acetylglucosaminephosphotransferase
MEIVLFSCFIVSFLSTFVLIPRWIRKAGVLGLTGRDMNKYDKRKVAEAGGITVIIGSLLGILCYIFIKTFYLMETELTAEILAVATTILLAGFIGFVDDILGWKSGVSQKTKVLSTIPIAIPMAVVSAGTSSMILPVIGYVDFGILFPLLIVPIGMIGATNGFNMLAGYNGLEAGMGIIILTTLGVVAWVSGVGWVSVLSMSVVFSLLAFLWYNKPPASIFPGDTLTYIVGASIVCITVLGNMEKIAIVLFLPYILFEAVGFLKYKMDRFRDKSVRLPEAFATNVYKDGSIEFKAKIYGFEPIGYLMAKRLKRKVYERDVTASILGVECLLAASALFLWHFGVI